MLDLNSEKKCKEFHSTPEVAPFLQGNGIGHVHAILS